MKSFTIDRETNNITVHNSPKEAAAVPNAERFGNEGTLAKLAANWSADRLVEIWNTLPGAVRVRKFRDRKTAVNRIWKAVQSFGSALPVAPLRCDLPPEGVPAQRKAARAQRASTVAKPERDGSKKEAVVDLLKRQGGATLHAIMQATGWQAHSVRGFLSGTLKKKMGLTVVSAQSEDGQRTYSISA